MSTNTKTNGGWRTNKWIRAAIPALLLHCSIGTVYCWSTFSKEIGAYIGYSDTATGWAFSLAIFFLGMSAAFMGNIVEKNIHRSSLIAAICFSGGMAGTGACIWYGGKVFAASGAPSLIALIGIYIFYGLIMGIGLGTGYLSPVKTLMLWFKDNKGLATGLAVAGFGAAKAIASPIMEWMLKSLGTNGIWIMFLILATVYFVMMFIGHLLLKKPDDWHEPQSADEKKSIISVIKIKPILNYVGIWLMFYINITCGLMLISQEKMIFKCLGFGSIAGILGALSAVFNAGGRLGFSSAGDKCKDRNTIYKVIFVISILFTAIVIATKGIVNGANNTLLAILVIALIMVVNAGYGGGFSNVPTLLSDHYGMSNISAIHGITLSAWGFAGLTGNQLANWIVNNFGKYIYVDGNMVNPSGYQAVLYVTVVMYAVALLLSFVFVRRSGNDKSE